LVLTERSKLKSKSLREPVAVTVSFDKLIGKIQLPLIKEKDRIQRQDAEQHTQKLKIKA